MASVAAAVPQRRAARRRRGRFGPMLAGGLVLLVLAMAASLSLGAAALSADRVWGTLVDPADPFATLIVRSFRLPRIAVGVLVGANLAVAGALLQAIMRNPIADPGVVGISGGASLAAVLALVVWQGFPVELLPVAAMAGGLAAAAVVYRLAWRRGLAPVRLALSGVAVSSLLAAAVVFALVVWGSGRMETALLWLAGSLYARDWSHLRLLAPWCAIGLLALPAAARPVGLLRLGDEVARGLGLHVERARLGVLVLAVLLAASAVAVTGPIGFVGLIVPHIARALVGGNERDVLPVTVVLGAALVVIADMVGRLVIAPIELPVGIVTSILGVPFFLVLLRRLPG